jgi:hypothetical protein
MSADRQTWLRRRKRRQVEEEPEAVVAEMESATQRLRDQAWKINATTRTPLISEEAARSDVSAESER